MRRWETLADLIQQRNWQTGAELGVWQGKTYKYLLANCPNLTLTGVDLYEPQPNNTGPETWTPGENGHAWDHNRYYQDILQFQGTIGPRAQFLKTTTVEAAGLVEDNSLDFVFIDADHSYESVKQDIQLWSPKIKSTGCVIGHDINWPGVRQAVEETLGKYTVAPDNVWIVEKSLTNSKI